MWLKKEKGWCVPHRVVVVSSSTKFLGGRHNLESPRRRGGGEKEEWSEADETEVWGGRRGEECGGRRYSRYWRCVLLWLMDRQGSAGCWLRVEPGGAARREDAELTGWNQPAESGNIKVVTTSLSEFISPHLRLITEVGPARLQHQTNISELRLVFRHRLCSGPLVIFI